MVSFGIKARNIPWFSLSLLGALAWLQLSFTSDLPAQASSPERMDFPKRVASTPAELNWQALDAKLASFVGLKVQGLSFVLVDRAGVLFQKGYGNLGIHSVGPIASCSKMPSALVVLTLVDEGLIDLDRPIGDYLKGYVDWPVDKAAITTRMLLNHTSGLAQPPCLSLTFGSTPHDCTQVVANLPLEFSPPGSYFAYSNTGLQVAGYVAEVLTGRNWYSLFDERLGGPLHLNKYSYGQGVNPGLANGAVSDTSDYGTILRLFLNRCIWSGQVIASPEIWNLMRNDQVVGVRKVRPDDIYGYSCGWWITPPSDYQPLGSLGPELCDPGSNGCMAWVNLDLRYGAFLFLQNYIGNGEEIRDTVRPLIIAQFMTRPLPGDLNDDGVRDVQDTELLAEWLADAVALPVSAAALGDVDGDGSVTVNDLLWMECALAGWPRGSLQ